MLGSIRNNKQNFFFTFIILATVAVMAFFGFGGFNSQLGMNSPVAWVNGKAIPREVYQFQLEQRLEQYRSILGDKFDQQMIERFGLKQQIVNGLVDTELLRQKAEQLGFRIPDKELADFIRGLPYFQKDGVFDPALYQSYRTSQRDPGRLEREQREQMKINKFRDYLISQVHVTEKEVKNHYQLSQSKVALDFVKINFNELSKSHKPTAEQLAQAKQLPDAQFKNYYDTHLPEFTKKGRVYLHQIRVGVPFQASDEKKASAKKKIVEASQNLKTDTFAQKAKQFSDDEYAQKGGLVGWVERGSLSTELETAIDSLKVNSISPVVETPFGYFLLWVEKNDPQQVAPLDSVRDTIATHLAKQQYEKDFEKNLREKWDAQLKKGQTIVSDLKSHSLKVENTGLFSLNSTNIPKIGYSEGILDVLFKLSPEHPLVDHLVSYRENFYFIKLTKWEPAKMPPNTEALTQARDELTSQIQNELFGKWLEKLRKQAKIKFADEFKTQDIDTQTPPTSQS